jgi:hypothetical protein
VLTFKMHGGPHESVVCKGLIMRGQSLYITCDIIISRSGQLTFGQSNTVNSSGYCVGQLQAVKGALLSWR